MCQILFMFCMAAPLRIPLAPNTMLSRCTHTWLLYVLACAHRQYHDALPATLEHIAQPALAHSTAMLLHITDGKCTPPCLKYRPSPLHAAGQEGLVRKYGKAFKRLGWWEMHCAAQSVLPEDVICFDSRFARCGIICVQHR
jgi:hypothetical protein